MTGGKKTAVLFIFCLLLLAGYRNQSSDGKDTSEYWGSFTAEKTYSYDEKYYAIQEVEEDYIFGDSPTYYIRVRIYETDTDTEVFNFCPARARDFWGICWENDTYNIWTQSGDIGVYCYKYEDMQWIKDESAKRPEYIISKYDKHVQVDK